MRYIIIISIFFLLSCGKDSIKYPKSYTFSNLQQFPEGLFLLSSPTNPISLGLNVGSYGKNRESIRAESAEFIKLVFDLQEIELLSENTVRIHIKIDEEEIDTIVSYTMEDENIVIEALADTDIIRYDSEEDQFIVCGFTTYALPGPNVLNPGQPYYDIIIEDCLEIGNLNEHLDYALEKNNYLALDTIGIIITKFLYK